jgi:hypothetical protein
MRIFKWFKKPKQIVDTDKVQDENEWVDLEDGGVLPPERERVKVSILNGNFSYGASGYYHIGGKWFSKSDKQCPHGVEVFAWKNLS